MVLWVIECVGLFSNRVCCLGARSWLCSNRVCLMGCALALFSNRVLYTTKESTCFQKIPKNFWFHRPRFESHPQFLLFLPTHTSAQFCSYYTTQAPIQTKYFSINDTHRHWSKLNFKISGYLSTLGYLNTMGYPGQLVSNFRKHSLNTLR